MTNTATAARIRLRRRAFLLFARERPLGGTAPGGPEPAPPGGPPTPARPTVARPAAPPTDALPTEALPTEALPTDARPLVPLRGYPESAPEYDSYESE